MLVGPYEVFLFAALFWLTAEWLTLSWQRESIYYRIPVAAGIVTGALVAAKLTPVQHIPYVVPAVLYIRGFMLAGQLIYYGGRRVLLMRYGRQVIRRSQFNHAVQADNHREERSELELGGNRARQYDAPTISRHSGRGDQ